MEYEISDRPDHVMVDEDDSKLVKDRIGKRRLPLVAAEDHPAYWDRALHIPEQED
jgi:hypothetical protein